MWSGEPGLVVDPQQFRIALALHDAVHPGDAKIAARSLFDPRGDLGDGHAMSIALIPAPRTSTLGMFGAIAYLDRA